MLQKILRSFGHVMTSSSYDIAAEVGGADVVTHAHLTASYTMSRDQMGRCDWLQRMTHGRVTVRP